MIIKGIKRVLLLCFIPIIFSSCGFKRDINTISSLELKNTVITPHMEAKLQQDKNTIYCSTFQLAWNELKDNIVKEDIKLKDEEELVKYLNKSLSKKQDISEKDYIALVGFKKDGILDKINKEMREKFQGKFGTVKEELKEEDFFAYSFLYKKLEFTKEFESIKEGLKFQGKDKIKAFGIKEVKSGEKYEEIIKQVDILHYASDKEFILRLNSKSENDEIILAKIAPMDTLLKTISSLEDKISQGEKLQLQPKDSLMIPCISFDLNHSYSELENKQFLNERFKEYEITKATQLIKFDLNEKGAELKSEARIVGTKSAPMINQPKKLIFDKPFLLIMREKHSKSPYLALWINNEELLLK